MHSNWLHWRLHVRQVAHSVPEENMNVVLFRPPGARGALIGRCGKSVIRWWFLRRCAPSALAPHVNLHGAVNILQHPPYLVSPEWLGARRRGWLDSSSSSSFSFPPPSSPPSPVASGCPGLAGETLSAKADHVSWNQIVHSEKLPPNISILQVPTFDKPKHWRLWKCGNGGREEENLEVSLSMKFHVPSHCVAYWRDCNKYEKVSSNSSTWYLGASSSTEFHVPSHCIVFCFASLAEDLRNFLCGRDKILGFLCIWNLLYHSMKIHGRLYPIFARNTTDNACVKNSVMCKI